MGWGMREIYNGGCARMTWPKREMLLVVGVGQLRQLDQRGLNLQIVIFGNKKVCKLQCLLY